jgi:C4-dicarboxylate-specific signal transduction histidine kinase
VASKLLSSPTEPAGESTASATERLLQQLMEVARLSALAEMASGIAHVVNQPLGAIATFAQAGERLLKRPEPLMDRALEVLRQINAEAMQAAEDLRKIRRLFDHHAPHPTLCDFAETVREIEPLLRSLARQGHVELRIDIPENLPAVSIDRLRIQHVVLALVQNAVDAASGRPHPRVELKASADRYGLECGISDSGPGVPAQIKDQLFRPFFTTKPHGTGLGLAAGRAILQAHQGSLGYENLAAGGCRFWFRIPLDG